MLCKFYLQETRERKWCMTFDYDGYPGTGKCWYGQDSRPCSQDQIHLSKCSNDHRQRFLFVDLDGGEALIKVGNGENKCFQRNRRSIFLRTCDANNSLQRWYAPNGSFDGHRFEISQKDFGTQCVTTAHHPKAGKCFGWLFRACLLPCLLNSNMPCVIVGLPGEVVE